jgi:hypothetical protein
LREGKLFEIESNRPIQTPGGVSKPVRRIEFFWLCGKCSAEFTVVNDHEKGVMTVPLPREPQYLVRRASAAA